MCPILEHFEIGCTAVTADNRFGSGQIWVPKIVSVGALRVWRPEGRLWPPITALVAVYFEFGQLYWGTLVPERWLWLSGEGLARFHFRLWKKKRNIQIFENPKNEKTEITKFPFADQNFELCFWRNLLPSPAFPAPLFFSVVFNWEKVAWLIVHQNAWDLSIAGTCECKSPIISISEGKCWTTYKFFSISWNEIQEIEKHLKFFSISWNEIQEIEKHL